MDRLLIRPTEAAELLSIGRTRIYEMLAQKELSSVRIGRSIRVPMAELQRWIEEKQAQIKAKSIED